MSDRYLIGVFEDETHALAAVRACREGGARVADVYAPYAVHGMEDAMGLRRSRLPVACFVFGVLGGASFLWFQYWSSWFNWPVNVGGRPWNSLPAFLPVTFECTVLFAGLGTVAAFLLISRLYPGKTPDMPDARVSNDQFAVVLHARGGGMDAHAIQETLRRHHAVRVFEREAEASCATA